MGGAVSITAPKSSEKTLFMKNLVHDTESIKSLFMDISNYGKSNGIKCTKSNLVCLAVVLLYIENEVNPQLSQHYKGMLTVIKEAFYYVVGYKKDVRLELTSKKFHRFMDALFMFSHLYKVSDYSDYSRYCFMVCVCVLPCIFFVVESCLIMLNLDII
jgi:hypothetical protein